MQYTKSTLTLSLEKWAVIMVALFTAMGALAQVMPDTAKTIKPTVTFTTAPPASAMNGTTFTVAATTTNPNATVVITVAPTTICTITGDTVTMVANKGTCTTTATSPATTGYAKATASDKTTATLGYAGQVIYDFGSTYGDGMEPQLDGMVMDKSGNIYGIAAKGLYLLGMVFELTFDKATGAWTETDIHDFNPQSTSVHDGYSPFGMIAMDSKGNLYGTTSQGGTLNGGTVYELSPPAVAGGEWTETILYNFGTNSNDGLEPIGGVTLGNTSGTVIYGTTNNGGTIGGGTIWELSYTKAKGKTPAQWTESILYNFPGISPNGTLESSLPAGLLLNGGNLYGKACNEVYELANSGGTWTFNTLYEFSFTDGQWCNGAVANQGTVAMDSQKNIYGTASQGGSGNGDGGTAWELVNNNGTYTEQIIYNFPFDEGSPDWGLVYSGGSWYGATGGWPATLQGSNGIVFKLTYSASTGWTETTIYNQFAPYAGPSEVDYPGVNQLIVDTKGNLYGMGYAGGNQSGYGYGLGGVFEVSPLP